MTAYKELLDYCKTSHQTHLINTLIQFDGDVQKVSDKLGIFKTNIYRTIRSIKAKKDTKTVELPSGDIKKVPDGYSIKGTSTFYDEEGNPVRQWVKTDRDKQDMVDSLQEAVDYIVARLDGKAKKSKAKTVPNNSLLNFIPMCDLHFGLLADKHETLDRNYNLKIAYDILDKATDSLIERLPIAKECVVADLGDMLEADDFKNKTPKSGHNLDVDSRYGKVLGVALDAMIMVIDKALRSHEKVYFYNIQGNHDETSAIAIRKAIYAWYRNEPRVIVCNSDAFQKYHKHGSVLIGMAHGDGLKMVNAGEAMVMHNKKWYSETDYHEYHFGHFHKDRIHDGRLCKSESHRNLPPLNAWAAHAGFGRGFGTLKGLTYCSKYGRVGTTEFNIGMIDEL